MQTPKAGAEVSRKGLLRRPGFWLAGLIFALVAFVLVGRGPMRGSRRPAPALPPAVSPPAGNPATDTGASAGAGNSEATDPSASPDAVPEPLNVELSPEQKALLTDLAQQPEDSGQPTLAETMAEQRAIMENVAASPRFKEMEAMARVMREGEVPDESEEAQPARAAASLLKRRIRTYLREHPESSAEAKSFGLQSYYRGGTDPVQWLESQRRKWQSIAQAHIPLEMALGIRGAMSPFEVVPSETESNSVVMATAAVDFKGLLLEQELHLHRATVASTNAAVRGLRGEVAQARKRLEGVAIPASPSSEELARAEPPPRLNELVGAAGRSDWKLREAVSQSEDLEPPTMLSLPELQQALPTNVVLLEYLRYGLDDFDKEGIDTVYGVGVITRRSVHWVKLGEAKRIDDLVFEYRRLLSLAESNAPSSGQFGGLLSRLGEAVWRPVEPYLAGGMTNVIVSPDAGLHRLSFGTMMRNDRFVTERCLVRYASSGRDLLRTPPANAVTGKRRVAIWANPDFGHKPAKPSLGKSLLGSFRGDGGVAPEGLGPLFGELEATAKEASSLERLFSGFPGLQTEVRTKSEAGERQLRELSSPYILHLATHGFVLPEFDPGSSAPPVIGFPAVAGLRTPYRTGLALAGANLTLAAWRGGATVPLEIDGLLFAKEAAELDLRDTWLVVLAACDSGLGRVVEGEGVCGLSQAFREAGARNVMVSLWRVRDDDAPALMEKFYRRALTTRDAGAALASVQAEELRLLASKGDAKALWRSVRSAGPFVLRSGGL